MIKLRKVDYVSQAAELSAYLCNEVSRVALIEIGGQEMTASANHTASTIFLRGKLTVAKVAIILKQSGFVKVLTPGENNLLFRAMYLKLCGTLPSSHRHLIHLNSMIKTQMWT